MRESKMTQHRAKRPQHGPKRTFEGQKGQNEATQDKRAERAPILALSFLEDLSRVQSCEGLPRIVSDFYGL